MDNDLVNYYERFYQVLLDELDQMLTEVDPNKRSPKGIAERLKLADECQGQIRTLKTDVNADLWAQLSQETKDKITALINQELGQA